jgi:hypothetical protein
VSVAGVDTVGRPGLASGTDDVTDCARLSRAKALNMQNKQIGMIFNLSPLKTDNSNLFPKQMRHVPARVGRHSQ